MLNFLRGLGICLVVSALAGVSLAQGQTATVTVVAPKIEDVSAASLPTDVLKEEVEAALVATRVFTVLTSDSQELQTLLDEIMAGKSGKMPDSKTAQFVIIPSIQAVEMQRSARPIPRLSSQIAVSAAGLVRMRVRVLETRTGVLKAPFPVDVDWEGESEVMTGVAPGPMQPRQADFVAMAREAGRVCASRVLDQIYPVEVIGRSDNQVWISRGGDAGYEIGEVLRIMTGKGQSEELIHPVTGEVLGVQEKLLGRITITDVQPKFTVGEITDESGGAIIKGSIVRK